MIETELEPPLPDFDDDEDDEPTFSIAVILRESDGTGKSAYILDRRKEVMRDA